VKKVKATEKALEVEKEKVEPVEEILPEDIVSEETEVEPEHPPMIENIKADKLEGPKILGKIQLPVDSETRPKPNEEKRKRKRIPIEKKQAEARVQREGFNREVKPQQAGNFRRDQQGTQQRKTITKQGDRRTDQRRPVDKEIDQKEIQNKIRETQAKLAGAGGRGKSLKAKHRRARREEMAEMGNDEMQDNLLQLTEFISVSELANLMDVSYADVISKCMSLGLMVSINQRLDAEVIELVANEFGYQVEFVDMEKQTEMEEEVEEDDEEELQSRSPIVTIIGHVDHGKTSLLDYIRSANVVAGEAGGITQHVGAYQVELPTGKEITFLDTPGHEAFTAMRARGAKVTDIAVIVIAADDAVMPQTKEAISHAQAAGVPMIFAVNKIDKDGANSQKIYEQLAGMNLLVESWVVNIKAREISAKQGLNVDLLLERFCWKQSCLN
jgi:translation initiation factor IF-2